MDVRIVLQRTFLLILCLGACPALSSAARAQAQEPRPVSFGPDSRVGPDESYLPGSPQEEPTIAVNPRNPDNLVAAFHDIFPTSSDFTCRFARTLDGGNVWTVTGTFPGMQAGEFCSDPSLGADLKGAFYLGYLVLGTGGRVVVAKSTDGGQSFPRFSISFQEGIGTGLADKPYLAVDNQPRSRFRGRVYLGWTLFKVVTDGQGRDSFEYRIVAQTSADGGSTWSAPTQISRTSIDPEVSQGSLPIIAPDGSAYIFYADSNRRTGVMSIRYSRTTDGGRSWGAPVEVAGGLPSPWFFTLRNADPPGPGRGFRALSGPFAAITPAGKIFVAWIDFPHGSCQFSGGTSLPACTNSDLRMSVSGDGGLSWSAPVKVTNESGGSDQFFAWVAAHPDGLVSIAWADRRLDPENVKFDIFYTNTTDGIVFLNDTRVTSAASDPGSDEFIGDYNNLAASASSVVAVWTDVRSGPPHSIFSAAGTLLP